MGLRFSETVTGTEAGNGLTRTFISELERVRGSMTLSFDPFRMPEEAGDVDLYGIEVALHRDNESGGTVLVTSTDRSELIECLTKDGMAAQIVVKALKELIETQKS